MIANDLVKFFSFSTAASWVPVLNHRKVFEWCLYFFVCSISWGYKCVLLMNQWSCAAPQSPDWIYCLESWSKLITVRCFVIGLEQLCKDTLSLREMQLAAAKIKKLVGLDGHPHWIMEVAFWWKGACAKLVGVVQWGCHWCDFTVFSA